MIENTAIPEGGDKKVEEVPAEVSQEKEEPVTVVEEAQANGLTEVDIAEKLVAAVGEIVAKEEEKVNDQNEQQDKEESDEEEALEVKNENDYQKANSRFFELNTFQQSKELHDFLAQERNKSNFNRYCLDCQKGQTTHFLLWTGTFVCAFCAEKHLTLPNSGQTRKYVKSIFSEPWDNFQLRSVQIGGNEKMYNYFQYYKMGDMELQKKYQHKATQWYIKRHTYLMDGYSIESFRTMQPPKNMADRKQKYKEFYQQQKTSMKNAIQYHDQKLIESGKKDKMVKGINTVKSGANATKNWLVGLQQKAKPGMQNLKKRMGKDATFKEKWDIKDKKNRNVEEPIMEEQPTPDPQDTYTPGKEEAEEVAVKLDPEVVPVKEEPETVPVKDELVEEDRDKSMAESTNNLANIL